ncbi:DUF6895 family protein [Streptomyces johnsoniae]|uniref:DUF6895 domain-containing protein n=1 Tax=Streptomyces johnsoniae TaxID=3075532 RepID=A0ABU2S0R8_9ACTN|nr:hypothetical protein [Streptomyces sp. DSM 41886]MDT0442598.1 hypothetical protein [Streptomyces sp. DSM 41886]
MTAPVTSTAHRIATRALGWLHTHRARAGLPADTTADLGDPNSVYKPLGETALAGSLVLRDAAAGSTDKRIAKELLDHSWAQFRQGDLLYERQLRHQLMTDPLETYAHFARSGYHHEGMARLLRHNAGLASVRAAEVVPNRRLAIANAARLAGVDLGTDWDALARATWLGAAAEPWAIDWMTAYAMTHTVFHLTDWGGRPEGLPVEMAGYLTTWLPVWIDIWREVSQWDLVAELMIVGACLEEPLCDPESWAALAAVQHEDGLMPRDGEPVAEDEQQRFVDHQHTAVVAAVAGCVAVARTLTTTGGTGT